MKPYLKPPPDPPAIRDAMAKASKREEEGLPVFDFSSGNIGRLLLEFDVFSDISIQTGDMPDRFKPIAEALSRGLKKSFENSPEGLAYSPTGGTTPQKKTVINYFKQVHNVPLEDEDTDRVILTAGGQQAMATALRSISQGCKVIAPRWDYAPVTGIASDEDWKFCKLPEVNGFGFSLQDLKDEAEEGSVFYTSMPNNPSGYVSAERLEGAAEIMSEKNGGIIWDAPYLFTMFMLDEGKGSFTSKFLEEEIGKFAKIPRNFADDMCILSSISKTCLSAGLRFGFATGPHEWIQNMNGIIGMENLSSPTPSFIMRNEILKSFLNQGVKAHEWVSEILADWVNYLFEKGIPLVVPENGKFGALYVLMKARGSGSDFADKLGEEGVISVTGEPFYGGSVDMVRLSLVSVPFVEGGRLWKENVDNLSKVLS